MNERTRFIIIRAYALLVGAAGLASAFWALRVGGFSVPEEEGFWFCIGAIAVILGGHFLPVEMGPARVMVGSVAVMPVLAAGGPVMLAVAVAVMAFGSFAVWREPFSSYVFKAAFNAGSAEFAVAVIAVLWGRLGSVPPVVYGLSWTALLVAGLVMWAVPLALLGVMLKLTGSSGYMRRLIFSTDSAVSWFSVVLAAALAPAVREGGVAGTVAALAVVAGAAVFLWWASRLEETGRRHEELFKVAERLTKEMDSAAEAGKVAAEAMLAVSLADVAVVGVLAKEGVRVIARAGTCENVDFLPVEGSVEQALTRQVTVAVRAGEDDPATAFLGRRRLVVPLMAEGECIGVAAVGDRTGVGVDWPKRQVAMAELVARIAGGAIAAAARAEELELLAETDELTGLGNLRAFRAALREFVKKERGALLFVDIDGFKQVNDRWGHEAGDAVLKGVARALRSAVREKDRVFRYAGDEFVALLDGAGCDAAGSVVARIEKRLSELRFVFGGDAYAPSVSVGYAVIPDDGTDEQELVATADRHMYKRKRERRRLGNGGERP